MNVLKLNRLSRELRKGRVWLAIALVGCLLICTLGPLKVIFDHNFLVQHLQAYRRYTIGAFIVIYVFLTVIGIPGTILTIAGGLIFGLFWGTFWSVIGATLGALGAFWTARYLLRDYLRRKFKQYEILANFDRAVVCTPFAFVLAVRFAPISPFNLVNFLFGLTPIHWMPYTFATLIGIIPGTLIYSWLGVSGNQALQGSDRVSFFIALGLLAILSVMPIWVRKKLKR
jgi:uncharacterized membrane protein YdjX (TVP38/TMEM64 family)